MPNLTASDYMLEMLSRNDRNRVNNRFFSDEFFQTPLRVLSKNKLKNFSNKMEEHFLSEQIKNHTRLSTNRSLYYTGSLLSDSSRGFFATNLCQEIDSPLPPTSYPIRHDTAAPSREQINAWFNSSTSFFN